MLRRCLALWVGCFLLVPVYGLGVSDSLALPRAKAHQKTENAVSAFLGEVREKNINLHSIMVVRNGHVVAEGWFGDNGPEIPHVMNSVSKTFTAVAIGLAVDEGKLKATDRILPFFPEFAAKHQDSDFAKITIEHLLTMTSGVRVEIRLNDSSLFNAGVNWVETFFSAPIAYEPGTRHVYSSMSTYMLSAILQKVTGEKLVDYLAHKLFAPLGISGATWMESPQGINVGGWGLFIRTEDMAKLGQLLLQKGHWAGVQLLSPGWVEKASSKVVETHYDPNVRPDWAAGYGYQLWQCSRYGAYRADGAHGQFIVVVPKKKAVIAMTSHVSDMQLALNLVWKHLVEAL